MSSLADAEARVADLLADLRQSKAAVAAEARMHAEAVDGLTDAEEAQKICQLVAQSVQEQAHKRISAVVTRCLAAVFDDPYQFRIKFEQKRGKTEASLLFVREGVELDPLTASGGGAVDIAAFALRVACVVMARPAVARVLVMDEPFKFLSAQYRDRARLMLETLSTDLGVQIVMVTHIEELKTGEIVEL